MASLFSLTKELGGCGDPRAFVDFIAENPVTRQKIQIKAMVDTGSVNCGIRRCSTKSRIGSIRNERTDDRRKQDHKAKL
mgnify:CR=1 FL=1